MKTRPAIKQDASTLRDLLAQLGDEYQRSAEEIENRILSFDRARHQLLVAEDDGVVVGFIALGCYEQFRLQGCCCHIDTVVVDKNCRGKGVGKILIQLAEQYAKEQGATEIELTSANYRKAHGTHAFYKSIGYQDHLDIDCTYFAKQRVW